MAVYKTKAFARFARKESLADDDLAVTAKDVASGLADADLGGGVFKQRVARVGAGKSGGYRVIIFFKVGRHAFFVHGFAKKDRDNVEAEELKALKMLAKAMLAYDDEQLAKAVTAGELIEVQGR